MQQQTPSFEETCWQAILDRDPIEGLFYGVRSTGIYCQPTCPSRKPNRSQVRFFQSAEAAEAAGFRPCKRCLPQDRTELSNPARAKVLLACRYIEAHVDHIPTLSELGTQVGISPSHLQKVFKQIIGISPFEYADALRSERFKQQLQEGEEIARALYDTGYGSSSRLYEKAPKQLGMTPATYRQNGQGKTIRYAIVQSPLGYLLVAATDMGLCSVRLGDVVTLEQQLKQEFPKASLQPADHLVGEWIQTLVNYLSGTHPWPKLPLDVQATAFQRQVWNALLTIPAGRTVSYSDIARAIKRPTAVRAVAHACAVNPVALAIPCHRVVAKDGGLSGYRWGIERKRALLNLESQLESSEEGDL